MPSARATALCQLGDLIVTAPATLGARLSRKTLRGQASLCAHRRPNRRELTDPVHAAKLALRTLARRIGALDAEIAELDEHLEQLVRAVAPRTVALLGIGPHHASQLLVTAGQNITRLHSEAAFAHLCGVDPIPASSGKTTRYRLNPGGDRDANSALHLIAIVRLHYCQRTQAYAARRTTEGRSKRESVRCLKRYIAREVYRTLRANLADLAAAAAACWTGPSRTVATLAPYRAKRSDGAPARSAAARAHARHAGWPALDAPA